MTEITTFLMFDGKAAEAMQFYVSLFPGSEISSVSYYGENEGGAAGTVRHAVMSLNGRVFMCIDSPVKHAFTFTPAMSLYVTCESDEQIEALAAKLSDGGAVLMELAAYPFSPKYTWLNDRYGVSWQLALVDRIANP